MKVGFHGAALAVVMALPSAYAQQAVEKGERIEVTGSRIAASSDLDSASPIAVIRAEDMKLEGFQSIELILNNYPQFFADQGTRITNGATGTATANLRALGAQRTLVLMNGKRMPAGSPFALSPDLNQIPPQLIQRVEILTGGASAVYGSDAIAGVVNFIMKDHFEGVQGDVTYDFYNHQQHNSFTQDLLRQANIAIPGDKAMDGESINASITLGGNFAEDKGNATVSMRYFKSQSLLESERDYSACALNSVLGTSVACGGSPTGNPGRFVDLGFFPSDPTIDQQRPQQLTLDPVTGRVRNFRRPGDLYNFAPTNYYQRPQERYQTSAFANYAIAPDAKVYAEFGYHDDHTVAQIAPSATFGLLVPVRYENPLLSSDWRSTLLFRNPDGTGGTGPGTSAFVSLDRRNTEGGGRQDDIRLISSREVIGLRGTVAAHWDYDAFFQTSRVNYSETYKHDFSITRLRRALDVVADPVTGAAVCASALNGTDRRCIPFNVWTLNGVTQAAVDYVEAPAFQRALMSQQVAGATVTANLGDYGIRLPRTSGGVEVALGVERRTEKLDFEADEQFKDLAGQGPKSNVNGGFMVKDFFGELRVPVYDVVSLNGSYRRSEYDTGVKTNTFGVGFNATPAKYLRMRGSYQKAARAPDARELFEPQVPDSYSLNEGDPCSGELPARALSDCRRTGVTPSQYGHIIDTDFRDYPASIGGNSELKPETAKTYTIGMVLTPTGNLSATVDYFDARIDNTIASIKGDVIFQQCLDTGDPFFCGLVTRDRTTGALWFGNANVVAINQNIGKTRVSGADVSLNYQWRLPQAHRIVFDGLGTYLREQSVEKYPNAPSASCAGLYISACTLVPLPKWRHRLRAAWRAPYDFELATTWRYVHSTKIDPEVKQDNNLAPAVSSQPAVSYFDIAGNWNITKRVTLTGGVNNIADKDPPLVFGFAPSVNGNAFSQVYDVLGRHVFVSASVKF